MAQNAWLPVMRETVLQYGLAEPRPLSILTLHKAAPAGSVTSGRPRTQPPDVDELVVAGYASPQIIDQQRHLITKEALARDLPRFLANRVYRNANLLHTNIQVGEVLPHWVHPRTGEVFRTKVDDVGLFAVVRIRTDEYAPPVMQEVIQDILDGKLASFSISADAPFEARRYVCKDGVCFYIIDRVYFYEFTICQKPVNQDARFSVISKAQPTTTPYTRASYCTDGSCALDPSPTLNRAAITRLDRKYARLLTDYPVSARL